MGFIREPDGVEFTVVPVKLTAKDKREISEFIAEHRRQQDNSEAVHAAKETLHRYEERQQLKSRDAKAHAARKKLELEVLSLPTTERTQLAYQLLSSLASEETDQPQRKWASAAKSRFEKLQSPICLPLNIKNAIDL